MKVLGTFERAINRLAGHYGEPLSCATDDPFALVLRETVAYLADDSKRDKAFTALKKEIGLAPTGILAASEETLLRIAKFGGIHSELRTARLREIAQITLNDFSGDLRNALKLPQPQAIKALKKFPSIGEPGAEKILLFTKTYPVLALESNGLRVLLRLGFGEERKSYASTYRSVQNALKGQIGEDCDSLIRAHQLLRQHGKELCRRTNPVCEPCPLKRGCRYYQSRRGEAPGRS